MVRKILMVNTAFSRGGAAKIAQSLHEYLNNLPESSSFFAYGRGDRIDKKNLFRFSVWFETYLHALITRTTGLEGYGTFFSTRKLEEFILEEKFDLIHLHNIHGYYLDLKFIEFLKRNKFPVIWTFHDAWPITGSCGSFLECDRWKDGCGKCPDKYRYPKTYIDSSAYMWRRKREIFSKGWNPIITTPSRWLADKVRESYFKNFDIRVIPNAINTNVFKPMDQKVARAELGLPKNKRIVLFIAANLEYKCKGSKYFFKSLPLIDNNNFIVITVGKKIKNLKQVFKLGIDIRQLGYISNRGLMAKIYNAADLFCATSLQDNFPTTVNESLSTGTPIAGFKAGGIPEQVTDGCGILVEPKDTKGLAKAISDLLNNNEKREIFGENCRQRALANYSVKKFGDRYLDLYKTALK